MNHEASSTRPTIEDHVAIVDLMARYCTYLDRHDVDAWVGLFTEDAVYEVYGITFEGHEGMRKMMTSAPGGLHLGGVPVVEMLDDGRARTLQSLFFYPVTDEPARRAIYTDELRRTPDGWRIARRRCDFITADGIKERPD